MNLAVLSFIFIAVILPIFGVRVLPNWWENPHGALFNIDQARYLVARNGPKPDLGQITSPVYSPFRIYANGAEYRGLITVKPDAKNKVKVGGLVFKGNQTESLGILDGELLDKGDHYQIKFSSSNGAKLFGAKSAYQDKTDFPGFLELRTHPDSKLIFLVNSPESSVRTTLQSIRGNPEKDLIGKWKSFGISGDWDFSFDPLPNNQLNGIATMTLSSSGKTCSYGLLAVPVVGADMLVMTGEPVQGLEHCPVYSWLAEGYGGTPRFEFLNQEDSALNLSRR